MSELEQLKARVEAWQKELEPKLRCEKCGRIAKIRYYGGYLKCECGGLASGPSSLYEKYDAFDQVLEEIKKLEDGGGGYR